jgi:hypothetical protein
MHIKLIKHTNSTNAAIAKTDYRTICVNSSLNHIDPISSEKKLVDL